MKKILAGLATAALLFGCGNSAAPTTDDPENPASTPVSQNSDAVALTDAIFIDLSAEILCLPANNPDASSADIELLARGILADANVAEEDYWNYQQTIEADSDSKQEISLAIVGRMPDFCEIEITEPTVDEPTEN